MKLEWQKDKKNGVDRDRKLSGMRIGEHIVGKGCDKFALRQTDMQVANRHLSGLVNGQKFASRLRVTLRKRERDELDG